MNGERKEALANAFAKVFNLDEVLWGKVIKGETILHPKLELNIDKRKYSREIKFGSEVFENNGGFLVKSNAESQDNLIVDYVSKLKYANSQGIYIYFNETHVYVGQTVRSFLTRLKEHVVKPKSTKKKNLFEGALNVIFFGRVQGVGKDILDYMEKEIIATLKLGGREVVNGDNGNTSFISDDRKIYANYILDSAYQTCFLTDINPFEEFEVSTIEREDTPFKRFARDSSNKYSSYSPLNDNIDTIKSILNKFRDTVHFIEYTWPTSPNTHPIPLEYEGEKAYYSRARDGDFPEDFEAAKVFDEDLKEKYLDRLNHE